MLRDKANFVVLEGFESTILNQTIKIVELLESESNQEYENDKFNRVGIKARMWFVQTSTYRQQSHMRILER